MARANLHATLQDLSGAMGEVVFKRVRGRTIVTKKPVFDKKKKPSAAQRACRQRFKAGTDYAKIAQDDPRLWAVYEPVARERQVAVFTVALKDFLNAPEIRSIHLGSYNGRPGGTIGILAADDFGLADMEVSLTDLDGMPLERGQAVENKPHSGCWIYSTTAEAAPGARLLLEVTGADYAGNRVRVEQEIVVGQQEWIDIKVPPRRAKGKSRRPQPRTEEAIPAARSEEIAPMPDELAVAGPICEMEPAAAVMKDLLESSCTSQPVEEGLAVREPEESDVAPAQLCEEVQAGDHTAEPLEVPYLLSPGQPAEVDGDSCVREPAEAEVTLVGVSPQRLPVRLIWWTLLAALQLAAGGAAGHLCSLEIAGERQYLFETEKQTGIVMKCGLAPPPGQ